MNIQWSERAIDEATEILTMVAEYAGFASTERYQAEFDRLISLAAENPQMGKTGIIKNTRELYPINGKYRVVYEIENNALRILTVKSTRKLHQP
ncbi:MAG: type II toxin-antitoxin system RelE/ParE family toxin [Neisseria sp.]|nr:type II toxin-antitoxin system RelE/ParE family toxin [Neisseria sp.]